MTDGGPGGPRGKDRVEVFTPRERRWLDVLLVLATVIAFLVAVDLVSRAIYFFGDVILTVFLAWLLAFIISPLGRGLTRLLPWLPRAVAIVVAYLAIVAVVVAALVLLANSLVTSTSQFVADLPRIQASLPAVLAPVQDRLAEMGLAVDLSAVAVDLLDRIRAGALDLLGPLQEIAVAGLGVLGQVLVVVFLSIYIAVDADAIAAFLFRLVPPRYADEAQLLRTAVGRSFGGFLRGQALMGLLYGLVAALTSLVLGIPFMPLTAVTSGVLQAIPFFGPFVSWAPPVVVAVVARSDAILPALGIMGVGWFILMNVVQPRLLGEAVGIHPVVVLMSFLVGLKVAGPAGAFFGIPVAAIVSAFFFHLMGRYTPSGPVAHRAARRLGALRGRPYRVPREPRPGEDQEIVDEAPLPAPSEGQEGSP